LLDHLEYVNAGRSPNAKSRHPIFSLCSEIIEARKEDLQHLAAVGHSSSWVKGQSQFRVARTLELFLCKTFIEDDYTEQMTRAA
jgi:hypothetical protein